MRDDSPQVGAQPTVLSELVDRALAAAVRAPSPHNTQPWLFHVDGARIDVLLDESRVLRVSDPAGVQARIAGGAAIVNMVIALRAAGRRSYLVHETHPDRPNLLASLHIGGGYQPTAEDEALARAISNRHSNRRPLLDKPVPQHVRGRLAKAATEHFTRLVFVDPSTRYATIAGLVRRAFHVQATDPAFGREAAQWTGRAPGDTDGVGTDAAGPPPDDDGYGLLALRQFPGRDSVASKAYEQQPLLAVVCVRGRTVADQVTAGMAIQHVLLAATANGLCTSFVSQPFEVAETRAAMRREFQAEGEPYTLLRIGYGYPATPTPRRSYAEVTSYAEPPG